jgi:hypothetical protein
VPSTSDIVFEVLSFPSKGKKRERVLRRPVGENSASSFSLLVLLSLRQRASLLAKPNPPRRFEKTSPQAQTTDKGKS